MCAVLCDQTTWGGRTTWGGQAECSGLAPAACTEGSGQIAGSEQPGCAKLGNPKPIGINRWPGLQPGLHMVGTVAIIDTSRGIELIVRCRGHHRPPCRVVVAGHDTED